MRGRAADRAGNVPRLRRQTGTHAGRTVSARPCSVRLRHTVRRRTARRHGRVAGRRLGWNSGRTVSTAGVRGRVRHTVGGGSGPGVRPAGGRARGTVAVPARTTPPAALIRHRRRGGTRGRGMPLRTRYALRRSRGRGIRPAVGGGALGARPGVLRAGRTAGDGAVALRTRYAVRRRSRCGVRPVRLRGRVGGGGGGTRPAARVRNAVRRTRLRGVGPRNRHALRGCSARGVRPGRPDGPALGRGTRGSGGGGARPATLPGGVRRLRRLVRGRSRTAVFSVLRLRTGGVRLGLRFGLGGRARRHVRPTRLILRTVRGTSRSLATGAAVRTTRDRGRRATGPVLTGRRRRTRTGRSVRPTRLLLGAVRGTPGNRTTGTAARTTGNLATGAAAHTTGNLATGAAAHTTGNLATGAAVRTTRDRGRRIRPNRLGLGAVRTGAAVLAPLLVQHALGRCAGRRVRPSRLALRAVHSGARRGATGPVVTARGRRGRARRRVRPAGLRLGAVGGCVRERATGAAVRGDGSGLRLLRVRYAVRWCARAGVGAARPAGLRLGAVRGSGGLVWDAVGRGPVLRVRPGAGAGVAASVFAGGRRGRAGQARAVGAAGGVRGGRGGARCRAPGRR